MWQFATGEGMKTARDVAQIILIFYYAYNLKFSLLL